jgi:predicted dehydrogenase
MLSAAIVGFGYSTRTFHAPLVSSTPGVQLDAIVQRSGDEAAAAYPSSRVFRSVEDMLARSQAELVVIATSNLSHFPLAKQCLLAGKNVVVDKPFTVTLAEAEELVALAEKTGKVLSVFHNRRWDGDFLTLQKLLSDGQLGYVVRFNSNFDRFRPTVDTNAWRQRDEPGSGIMFDLGPHMLDQTVTAFGQPTAIRASIRRERHGAQTDDAFDLALDFSGGIHATLGASMLACTSRPRFSIYGGSGSWVKHGLDPQEADLKRGQRPPSTKWGQEPDNAHGFLTLCDGTTTEKEEIVTLSGNYPAYYENVRDAIQGKAPLAVTPEQALRVMELLTLCQQSHREQRTVAVPPLAATT